MDADAIQPYLENGNGASSRSKASSSNSSSSSSSKRPPLGRLTPASRGTSRAPAPASRGAARAPAPSPSPIGRVDPMDSVLQRLERMPSGGSDVSDDALVAPPASINTGHQLPYPAGVNLGSNGNGAVSPPISHYSLSSNSNSSSSQSSGSSSTSNGSSSSSRRRMPAAFDTENVDDDWGSPRGFGVRTPVGGGGGPERSPSPDDSQTFLNGASY